MHKDVTQRTRRARVRCRNAFLMGFLKQGTWTRNKNEKEKKHQRSSPPLHGNSSFFLVVHAEKIHKKKPKQTDANRSGPKSDTPKKHISAHIFAHDSHESHRRAMFFRRPNALVRHASKREKDINPLPCDTFVWRHHIYQ